MVRCSALGCLSYPGMGKILHRFPRDPERRKKWEEKVKRENWKPKDNSYLCSDHFEETHYENRRADNLKRLKPFAVPTIFPPTTTIATTTATKTTTFKASKCASKARDRSRPKPERRNAGDTKNNAHDASQAPPCVFTEHSYSNTANEARSEVVASISSECAAGNGFQIDKVSKPDFTHGNSFLPSEPVPDTSFSSSFPSSSSSVTSVSSPTFPSYSTFSSSCSGKDEDVIIKREEHFDTDSVDSISIASSHYSSEEEIVKEEEKMGAIIEDTVEEFLCGSNECRIPGYEIPQQDASNDESLFTFVGISSHDEEKPATMERQADPNSEGGREKSPLFGNDDNSENEKISEQKRNVITNDVKMATLNFVLPDSSLASPYPGQEGEVKIRFEEIEQNMDSNGEGAEAVNMTQRNSNFETEYIHENVKVLQHPKSEVTSLTNSSAFVSSFSSPNDDRLEKMEQKMKQLEQALAKQRRKIHKTKKQRIRQEHVFAEVFTEDQLANLGRKSRWGVKWSKETIRKALLLLSACRPLGYKALLSQKLPLPSLGLLRRLGKLCFNTLKRKRRKLQRRTQTS